MSRTRARSEESGGRRPDVLALLKAASAPMSIARIADELRVHPNTVRFHLDALVNDGLVEQVQPDHRRPGRPPQMFRAVRRMNPGGPRRIRCSRRFWLSACLPNPTPAPERSRRAAHGAAG